MWNNLLKLRQNVQNILKKKWLIILQKKNYNKFKLKTTLVWHKKKNYKDSFKYVIWFKT